MAWTIFQALHTPAGLTEYGGGYDLYRSVRDARVAAEEQRVMALRKQRHEQQLALSAIRTG